MQLLKIGSKGIFHSYSQLFFADSKLFSLLLLLSTFVNPQVGLSGAFTTVVALGFSYWIGLNRYSLSFGTYSYNALMVGLVLGGLYQWSLAFVFVLIIAAILSVLLVVWLNTLLHKYNLPSLSLAFLLTLWIVLLGIRSYQRVELNDSGIYQLNEAYKLGGETWVQYSTYLNSVGLPEQIEIYLKSLSAVFFQYNILSGLIILIGLIIWSRIAFVLSVVGFGIGYFYYYSLAGEFSELYYSYIGFNFILTAVALGGYYVIPSRASFVLTIIAMPVIGILISALTELLSVFQLPLYSLPFTLTTLFVLMLLKQRTFFNRLALVPQQFFSPEKNLYHYKTNQVRFQNAQAVSIQLPFYGEWFVSQGYNGNITHKNEWQHALDFVVVDETQHTFKLPGKELTDFLCYGLPVLAPADGYVSAVADGIADNEIGEIDAQDNWGNSIVIKHGDYLYSKVSHLIPHTLQVRVNDYVKAGQIIGYCGSSGRSPEPHLHMQLQQTPYIGSPTLAYPLAYFISRQGENYTFHENSVPQEQAHIHHPIKTPILADAFGFIPGQKITFEKTRNQEKELVTWECKIDEWSRTYLYCSQSQSIAYFVNNGVLFYFTSFTGDQHSLLFDFYLGAQKVLLGYYPNLTLSDRLPTTVFQRKALLFMHDFIAPFVQLLTTKFSLSYHHIDNTYAPTYLELHSKVSANMLNTSMKEKTFCFCIEDSQLTKWTIKDGNQETEVICVK